MDQSDVNLAVVGAGSWGRLVLRNFAHTPGCRLRYICDTAPVTLKHQSELYPQARPTRRFRTVLGDPALDAVALATPAPLHYEMARAALEAGKHVFVEKPMALTADHAEELVELAAAVDRKLMVGHLLEYHPAVALMKELIEEGALGEVYYMYCQRLNLGVVREQENAFWSLAPHDVSVILYLFGAEPVEVEACGQSFLRKGVEDVVFATLRFADGRVAHIHVSWLDPHKERSMVLVGSEKMLVFDDMQASEKLRVFEKAATISLDERKSASAVQVRHGDIWVPRLPLCEPLAVETGHFIDCIRHDKVPRSDGRDGLRVVRILETVERRLRGAVPIPMRKAA